MYNLSVFVTPVGPDRASFDVCIDYVRKWSSIKQQRYDRKHPVLMKFFAFMALFEDENIMLYSYRQANKSLDFLISSHIRWRRTKLSYYKIPTSNNSISALLHMKMANLYAIIFGEVYNTYSSEEVI